MRSYQWTQLVVAGTGHDGQPATAEVRAVLIERDARPEAAWVPVWPSWLHAYAGPVGLS